MDYSDKSYQIQMAKEMLLENYDLATEYLDRAISDGAILPTHVLEWPLFIQFRKKPVFKEFLIKYDDRLKQQTINRDEIKAESQCDNSEISDIKNSFAENEQR